MGVTPNQITVARVLVAFAAAALFGRSPLANLAALCLIVAAIALDALDGYVARRYRMATPLGAQLDILGDRIIENLFFTYFAVHGLISLWVPVLFFLRGTLTDFVRAHAARSGRSAFGNHSMLERWWSRLLVNSRVSRAAYASLKCLCFCYLGVQLAVSTAGGSSGGLWLASRQWGQALELGSHVLVAAAVTFCLLRGLPVVWEGRRYFAALTRTSPLVRFNGPRRTRRPAPLAVSSHGLGVSGGLAGRGGAA